MKQFIEYILKKKIMLITPSIIIILVGLGCKKNEVKENSCKECPQAVYIQDFNNVSGTVKRTDDTDYIFNGSLFYILIDTEIELPELYAKAPQQKFIKVFSCSNINFNIENVDKMIKISGKLYNCITGDHGRQTNNLHTFKIFL